MMADNFIQIRFKENSLFLVEIQITYKVCY